MRHIISVLVENEFGVLARVAGLFSIRAFNIESLCVGETMDPTISRITLVTTGDDRVLAQITRQLEKLVCTIKVTDFKDIAHVERELVLIKVGAVPEQRPAVMQIVEIFRAKVVDVSPETIIIEVTGAEEKVRALLEMLKPYGIREIARTGKVAMHRGMQLLRNGARTEEEKAA